MQVQDVMAKSPKTCTVNANLAEAAALLWTGNFGALPVVDIAGRVIGIVTDRDICICAGTTNRTPSQINVGHVMSRNLAVCRTGDEIHCALKTMEARKVRRLLVISKEGKLEGMLSVSELLLHAHHRDGSRPELSDEDIISTLGGIYVHCPLREEARDHTQF
jgi:predicted transcriptional regulator